MLITNSEALFHQTVVKRDFIVSEHGLTIVIIGIICKVIVRVESDFSLVVKVTSKILYILNCGDVRLRCISHLANAFIVFSQMVVCR